MSKEIIEDFEPESEWTVRPGWREATKDEQEQLAEWLERQKELNEKTNS